MTKVLLSDSENIELLRLGETNSPLVVSLNSFQGRRYFDIRRHYLDKATKTIKPGPKGISLKEDEFESVSDFIVENLNQIKKAFTSNLKADEMAVRGDRREKVARQKLKTETSDVEYSFESWPGPNFFSVDESPGKKAITFNKRNKFIDRISIAESSSKELLVELIGAYVHAKSGLEFGKKVNPESVIDFLEVNWSHGLK
jgi:hypothetical protein